MVARTSIRKFLQNIVKAILHRIPIAGSVCGAATQNAGLLEHKDESDLKGMSVVYCVFGKENGTGIPSILPFPKHCTINGRDYCIVYISTSPIPITGGLLFAPMESVQLVDMSVESLMSVYLSMGVTVPQFLNEKS
jgi:uncharacterized membrane protein